MNLPVAPDSKDVASPVTFEQLAAARREWISQVLRPWCQRASLKELRKAELEWFDIAGRADTNATLWTWAWERFPDIVHPDLPGVHETYPMHVVLNDGILISGYPDARQSLRGMLVLVRTEPDGSTVTHTAVSVDEILEVHRVEQ